jgi:hypothetical protein
MNNNPCIIVAIGGNQLLMDIQRISDNTWTPPNEWLNKQTHLSESLCEFRIGSPTLPGAPKVLFGAPTCSQTYHNHSHGTPVAVIVLLYRQSEIPATLHAVRNALLGSYSLQTLMLLSLHSTSSQTLLESSTDKNTYCWCGTGLEIIATTYRSTIFHTHVVSMYSPQCICVSI